MKFLVDMPLSPRLAHWLREAGHGAVHAADLGMQTSPDQALIDLAREEDRIVLTADLDFPRLLALTYATGPSVVLFRGGSYSLAEMHELLVRVLDRYTADQLASSVVVVDKARLRRTPLPL